jgi:foldase protein PrsA
MRKFIWTAGIVLFLAGSVWLMLFSSKPLMTSSAGAITQDEYMKQVTTTSAGQNAYVQLVMDKVLGKAYSKTVTDKVVDSEFDKVRKSYGTTAFQQMLSQSGMDDQSYKNQIKQSLLLLELVKDKVQFTDEQRTKAYDDYTPDMDVSIITVADNDTATEVINKLNDGKKFADLAKEYSTDTTTASDGGKMPKFDSTSTTVDSAIVDAATGLKAGDYTTTAVQTSNPSGYTIVKLNSVADKKAQSAYTTILNNKLATDWMNDTDNTTKLQQYVGKVFTKYDVVAKSDYQGLKTALDNYILSQAKTSSSSSSSSK